MSRLFGALGNPKKHVPVPVARTLVLSSSINTSLTDVDILGDFPFKDIDAFDSDHPLFQDTYLSSEEELSPLSYSSIYSSPEHSHYPWSIEKSSSTSAKHTSVVTLKVDDFDLAESDFESDSESDLEMTFQDSITAYSVSIFQVGRPKVVEVHSPRSSALPSPALHRTSHSVSRTSSTSNYNESISSRSGSFSKASTSASSVSDTPHVAPSVLSQTSCHDSPIDNKPFRRSHDRKLKPSVSFSLDLIEEQRRPTLPPKPSLSIITEKFGVPVRSREASPRHRRKMSIPLLRLK